MLQTKVSYGYLPIQLDPSTPLHNEILEEWKAELARGLFTLGPAVERLETEWARYVGVRHAIGVNSGTDALIIALKALSIGAGDEVITCPNTFVATVGAIVAVGAKPVFVDAGPDYLIYQEGAWKARTNKTKALIPVDLTGAPAYRIWPPLTHDWENVHVIRDACQSIGATLWGNSSGKYADIAAYSLHPLKNVHACGDGGIIVTDNDDWAKWIKLYRNHGLADRDTVTMPGVNSRLDTLQAIAGYHILQRVEPITIARNANARQYDEGLAGCEGVTIPPRPGPEVRQAFHTYVIQVERRAELREFLSARGIETKIHYPIPVHLQPGYAYLGYKRGDFPNVERQAERILTLPVHEYLSRSDIAYVIGAIREFYGR